ncbi:MAG TPA: condensation domain-containing protein, partial [Verrucomicrobiae bacterium]|nr:condensation domain-containing protein [Verrucomicrobiae bacterium]
MSSSSSKTSELTAAEKRKLLAELLRKKAAAATAEFPLSYGQQGLFYLNRANPESIAYNTMFAIDVRSPLDVDLLRRALQTIVERHPALRTKYALADNQFVQRVDDSSGLNFQAMDASAWSDGEVDARLVEEAARPFDLERDSILRIRVYSRGPEDHVLLVGVHHICFDYWSYEIFVRELTNVYAALQAGKAPALRPILRHYSDYVSWQRDMLAGPRGEQLRSYWQKELAGELSVVNLPADRRRPAVQTFTGAAFRFDLPADRVKALQSLATKQKVTLYVLMLAAYEVFLHRYTDQKDVIVGTPMACREAKEFEDVIGYFANMLPLRARFSSDVTFREFLQQTRRTVFSALEHQDYPFSLLIEKLGIQRDPSRSPLFDVAFSWEKMAEDAGGQASGLRLHLATAAQLGAPCDMALVMFPGPQSLSGTFFYNTSLFDRETIARIAGHYQNVLRSLLENPDQRLSEISVLTERERRQVVEDWNRTERAYPGEKSLAELFEAQVERNPEATAVDFGEREWTYGELNRRANQLAHLLRRKGVERGTLVGVCLERSTDMVAALLAIVKAGGAYVPLDPIYPVERLTMMLVDTQAPVVVAQESTLANLPADWGEVVCVDRQASEIAAMSEENLSAASGGDDLAYVMYTSGSTGTPKGIEVEQRSVSRLVLNTTYVSLGPDDCVAQASNTSFDAATFEIWGALLNGARLVGVGREVMLSANTLAREIESRGITTMFVTTALFNQLVQQRPGMFGKMRNVLFGGEAVDPKQVRKVLEAGGPERLLHVYGPTETTTFATWQLVTEVAEE